ncbi:MAG: DUF1972 domain-containing protein [Desulfuromonadales bacterium]|nr:DUF1972 domain-containing protein [Desulfuromonadales bacterium]
MKKTGPVRLAILGTRGIPARYGGFETFAEELALRLAERNVDVTVYCEREAGADQPTLWRGVKLEYLPSPACGPLTTILFDLRCLWHARKGFEVVYMLGYGAAPFCMIPRLWGAKVWLNVDGIEWARAKWGRAAKAYFKAMEWFSTRVPHRIIADAEGIRTHLETRHTLKSPCTVIPYGAPVVDAAPDSELLAEWGLTSGGYNLVVARLEPENHVREIIEGYLAATTALPLIVVGNHRLATSYVESLTAMAGERVRFVGGVYDKVKLTALRWHCRGYFHGHSVGGTNPSLLEALGCGNLVIAHDNPFNREVCGPLGFFFAAPEDIPAIIAMVEGLPEGKVAELRQGAWARIRETYDWDRIANDYYHLLKSELSLWGDTEQ